MTDKQSSIPLAQKGVDTDNPVFEEKDSVTSSAGALALKFLEENRLKGRPIEIPSLGIVINGNTKISETN
jgi:hypothetical protein